MGGGRTRATIVPDDRGLEDFFIPLLVRTEEDLKAEPMIPTEILDAADWGRDAADRTRTR
jgi:hypothetical protein